MKLQLPTKLKLPGRPKLPLKKSILIILALTLLSTSIISSTPYFTKVISSQSMTLEVGDWTDPTAQAYLVSNNSANIVSLEENMTNGDFSSGLDSWSSQGQVVVLTQADGQIELPDSHSAMVKIGDPTLEHSSEAHALSHSFVSGENDSYLAFWYRVVVSEVNRGFDDPVIAVFLDEERVFQVDGHVDDWLMPLSGGLRATTWHLGVIKVPNLGSHQLRFETINSGDDRYSNALYLADVTSQAAVLTGADYLQVMATDNGAVTAHYQYQAGGAIMTENSPDLINVDPATSPDHYLLEYWAVDASGNTSPTSSLIVVVDHQLPLPPSLVEAWAEGDGEVSLRLTEPEYSLDPEHKLNQYQFWMATIPFTTPPPPDQVIPVTASYHHTDNGTLMPLGSAIVQDSLISNLSPDTYYLGLTTSDTVGNQSALSQVVSVTVN